MGLRDWAFLNHIWAKILPRPACECDLFAQGRQVLAHWELLKVEPDRWKSRFTLF